MDQLTAVLLFTKLSQQNMRKLDQKFNQRQNTLCLELQIYASPENFTPTLLVMLEKFRRSAITLLDQTITLQGQPTTIPNTILGPQLKPKLY